MSSHLEGRKINAMFIVPTLGRGGAETQLVELVNGLDNKVFNKTLVVFDRNLDQLARLDRSSLSFYHLPRTRKYDFSFIRKVARLIDQNEVDVIHCTLQISLLVGWLATKLSRAKPKMVVAIHTTVNVTRRFELFDQVLYRRLIAKCRRVIFVCEAQANYWKSKYPALASTSVVVYNGVDIDYFCRAQFVRAGEELKIRLEIPHYAPVVTCIAGFRQEKGHQYLIEAFTKLSGEPYLVLVGDGELRKAIEKIVESSPCQRRIIFLGEVADVRPILAATDVSVLASTAVETFSMAMLESMAMEVPMVATDIGGLSEAILPRQTGELVPPRNADKLAQVLSSYICNRQMVREIGKHARVNVTKQFSSDVMIRRTAAVLVEMVA